LSITENLFNKLTKVEFVFYPIYGIVAGINFDQFDEEIEDYGKAKKLDFFLLFIGISFIWYSN